MMQSTFYALFDCSHALHKHVALPNFQQIFDSKMRPRVPAPSDEHIYIILK